MYDPEGIAIPQLETKLEFNTEIWKLGQVQEMDEGGGVHRWRTMPPISLVSFLISIESG